MRGSCGVRWARVVVVVALLGTAPHVVTPEWEHVTARDLTIAAFNVRVFGVSYMDNRAAVTVLINIIMRYDIILIQEIRDISGQAIVDLLNQVNQVADNTYSMTISDRLGRTSSKEQYAFFYRHERVEVSNSYHYDDGVECPACDPAPDDFQREPYIVLFSTNVLEHMSQFVLAAIHAMPDEAVAELDHLADVYQNIVDTYDVLDVMILGDMNAGCGYVTPRDWPHIRLRAERRAFHWLIGDHVDTTVSGDTHCAYDRIVISGDQMRSSIVTASPGVYNFDHELMVTPTLAAEVSDHYPVEVALRGVAAEPGNASPSTKPDASWLILPQLTTALLITKSTTFIAHSW